jgi:hypothetical protein
VFYMIHLRSIVLVDDDLTVAGEAPTMAGRRSEANGTWREGGGVHCGVAGLVGRSVEEEAAAVEEYLFPEGK